MRNNVRHVIVGIALVAGAIAAGAASATPAAPASVPARLAGSWVKTMSVDAWQRHKVYIEPSGRWSIVITSGGVAKILWPPALSVLTTMPVAVTGHTVVFGPTSDGHCGTKASYTWVASGSSVVFKGAGDPCIERRVLLTAGPWARR